MLVRRLSTGLFGIGLLSTALVSGCNADYGLFKVHSYFDNTNYDLKNYQVIEHCKLTITEADAQGDDKGKPVLSDYILEPIIDTNNNLLTAGCVGGIQRANTDIGYLNYSTSRTTGSLTFTVNAYDHSDNKLQSGSATQSVKVFHGDKDLQPVEIGVKLLQ